MKQAKKLSIQVDNINEEIYLQHKSQSKPLTVKQSKLNRNIDYD